MRFAPALALGHNFNAAQGVQLRPDRTLGAAVQRACSHGLGPSLAGAPVARGVRVPTRVPRCVHIVAEPSSSHAHACYSFRIWENNVIQVYYPGGEEEMQGAGLYRDTQGEGLYRVKCTQWGSIWIEPHHALVVVPLPLLPQAIVLKLSAKSRKN